MALVELVVVEYVPITTCKTRNAPRKLFIVADARVLEVNDAGRFVGVAMFFPLYQNVSSV